MTNGISSRLVNISRSNTKTKQSPGAAVAGEEGEKMDGQMRKTSQKLCRTCRYSISTGGGLVCGHLAKARRSRGCRVGECDKYEKRGRRRK